VLPHPLAWPVALLAACAGHNPDLSITVPRIKLSSVTSIFQEDIALISAVSGVVIAFFAIFKGGDLLRELRQRKIYRLVEGPPLKKVLADV